MGTGSSQPPFSKHITVACQSMALPVDEQPITEPRVDAEDGQCRCYGVRQTLQSEILDVQPLQPKAHPAQQSREGIHAERFPYVLQ